MLIISSDRLGYFRDPDIIVTTGGIVSVGFRGGSLFPVFAPENADAAAKAIAEVTEMTIREAQQRGTGVPVTEQIYRFPESKRVQ